MAEGGGISKARFSDCAGSKAGKSTKSEVQ